MMMANETSKNTGQEPNKTVSTDNLTIPIEVAIADLAYGLKNMSKVIWSWLRVIPYLLRRRMRCWQMLRRHDQTLVCCYSVDILDVMKCVILT
ncbi:hypothetical protein E1A91_D11G182500v1 [Gossypium mustelinum]|uniref:Uncharacterized protein n=1 Tax=Gossypium mustelinum TaxID=34275 RepID=A0A5D2STN0_GOSMU|nr:hypothetical protein E1A91_D11G182500v1 [Gossypium mustelinum]